MFKMKTSCKHHRLVMLFALLCITVVAHSCASVSHVKKLRQIQEQFNSAASLENQLKTDPLTADARILFSGESNASYRLVLEDITKLIATKGDALQTDKLLGSAYTLKALTEWRLGEYDAAVKTSSVVANEKINLFPRDRALITALRGLIKNDQGFSHMMKKDHAYKDLKTLFVESVHDMNEGILAVPQENNIRTYLTMGKLAALKNWLDLFGNPDQFALAVPADLNKADEQREWCNAARPVWEVFVQEMDLLGTPEAAATKKWWGNRLALPAACQ